MIIAGRQTDPELREPLAHLARASGFPILAEPTSQMRLGPHDRSYVITTYDTLLRDEHWAHGVVPELVLRFGELPTSKPLRQWLAASGADQIVVDPTGGWNEPTGRAAAILRADPTECASGWAARLERLGRLEGGPRGPFPHERGRFVRGPLARSGGVAGGRGGAALAAIASEQLAERDREIEEAALHLALGRAHRDGDLVYTASSMPIRDQETFLGPGDADVLFLCNRGANGIDGLISSGIGAAHASGRPTTIVTGELGFLHDIGGLAALRDVAIPVRIVVIDNGGGGIFHFLPQQAALDDGRVRGPPRHPPRRLGRARRRPLRPPLPPPRVPRRPPRRPRRRHRPDRGPHRPRHQRRGPPPRHRARPRRAEQLTGPARDDASSCRGELSPGQRCTLSCGGRRRHGPGRHVPWSRFRRHQSCTEVRPPSG